MTRTNEKLLIGILAGIIIAGAAAFAIQPGLAGKPGFASSVSTPTYDVLTLRLTART